MVVSYPKIIFYLLSLICLLVAPSDRLKAASDPLTLAREKIASRNFRDAHQLLEKAMRNRDTQTADRLAILAELAGFYENQVGDDHRALKLWQRLLSKAPAAAPQRISAQRAIARIEDRQRRLAGVKRELNSLRMAAVQPGHRDKPAFLEKMTRQRKQLEQMANHFSLAADIDYTLGLTHLALGHFFRTDLCFGRVLAQFPAFGFQQPIARLRKTARQSWIRCLCIRASWFVLAVFWLVTAMGLAWSRPWNWLRWHHIGAGTVAVLTWIAVFQIMLHWPGRQSQAAEFVNRDGFYPTPTYVHTRLGSPESAVAEKLLYYGLAAVGGTFLLSVISARLRRQRLRQWIGGVGGLCLGLALVSQFYYSGCDNLSRFYRRNDSAAAWVSAQLAFRASEPEPYLLTEPRAYPGVELASISDPLLVDWLEQHVPNARRVYSKENID